MKLIAAVFGIVLQSLVSGSGTCALAAELQFQPEYLRTGPEGEIVPADRAAAGQPVALSLAGARMGYVSLQVIAKFAMPGEYSLALTPVSRTPG